MTDQRNQWGTSGAQAYRDPPPAAAFDAELGQIFLRMRNLLGYSLWDMARTVGSEPTVIADLEAGALGALPPWQELNRLVGLYASLTQVDATPILNRILRSKRQFVPTATREIDLVPVQGTVRPTARPQLRGPIYDQEISTSRPTYRALPPPTGHSDITPPVPAKVRIAAPTQKGVAVPTAAPSKRRIPSLRKSGASVLRGVGKLTRRLAGTLVVFLLMPILVVLAARLAPAMLYSLVSPLPAGVGITTKHGIDGLVAAVAPMRDGLTWIDIGDPRIRKADKLPEGKR